MLQRTRSAMLFVALVLTGIIIGGAAVYAAQGHMLAARSDLQSARAELMAARADKGGHREQAISLINQALNQTTLGIQAGAR